MQETAVALRAEPCIPVTQVLPLYCPNPSWYIVGTFLRILIQHMKQAMLNLSCFLTDVSKLIILILSACLVGRHIVGGPCNFSSLDFVHFFAVISTFTLESSQD